MVKVAINGFGRIGRLAFRQMFDAEGYEVVAINDLTDPKMLAHLLKYDTAQRGYAGVIGEGKHTVEATENSIIVDGKEITIYAKPNAAELPWGELNKAVDCINEAIDAIDSGLTMDAVNVSVDAAISPLLELTGQSTPWAAVPCRAVLSVLFRSRWLRLKRPTFRMRQSARPRSAKQL